MKELAERFGFSFLAEPWLAKALIAIVATVALNFFANWLLRKATRKPKDSTDAWNDILFHAARRPLPAVIWVVGIAFAAGIVRRHADDPLFDLFPPLRDVGVVTCFASVSYTHLDVYKRQVIRFPPKPNPKKGE